MPNVPDPVLNVAEGALDLKRFKAHADHLINGAVAGAPAIPALRLGRWAVVLRSSLEPWKAQVAARKHLAAGAAQHPYMVGVEQLIELLVPSGLWASLSAPGQGLPPVVLSFAQRSGRETFQVEISYRSMMHYCGMRSFNAVGSGLPQLSDIGWL